MRGALTRGERWDLGGNEDIDSIWGRRNAVVLVGRVFSVYEEAGAGAAVCFNEDGVTEDHGAIAGAVALGGAEVGDVLVILAVA